MAGAATTDAGDAADPAAGEDATGTTSVTATAAAADDDANGSTDTTTAAAPAATTTIAGYDDATTTTTAAAATTTAGGGDVVGALPLPLTLRMPGGCAGQQSPPAGCQYLDEAQGHLLGEAKEALPMVAQVPVPCLRGGGPERPAKPHPPLSLSCPACIPCKDFRPRPWQSEPSDTVCLLVLLQLQDLPCWVDGPDEVAGAPSEDQVAARLPTTPCPKDIMTMQTLTLSTAQARVSVVLLPGLRSVTH